MTGPPSGQTDQAGGTGPSKTGAGSGCSAAAAGAQSGETGALESGLCVASEANAHELQSAWKAWRSGCGLGVPWKDRRSGSAEAGGWNDDLHQKTGPGKIGWIRAMNVLEIPEKTWYPRSSCNHQR